MDNAKEILLVDDNPENLEFLEHRLRALGFTTSVVHDGAQAIASVRKRCPDLVIMDVTMPEVNGFQACREIKNIYPQVPIILLTAKSNPADRFWGMESGADDFLNKPIDPQLVVQRMMTLLQRAP